MRTAGYRRDTGDIPVTQAQVRQYGLRGGDHVEGTADSRDGRTKDQGRTLRTVETVNGRPARISWRALRSSTRSGTAFSGAIELTRSAGFYILHTNFTKNSDTVH